MGFQKGLSLNNWVSFGFIKTFYNVNVPKWKKFRTVATPTKKRPPAKKKKEPPQGNSKTGIRNGSCD